MSSKDLHGRMGLSDIGEAELSPVKEAKGSKGNFLEGLLGDQANFITTDALWSRASGSDDSGDTFEIPSWDFPGSPKSGRSRSPFSTATGGSEVDQLIADLKEQNDNLRKELDTMQQREVDLGYKLELAEDRLQKEIVMFEESASLKSDESRDGNSQSSSKRSSPGIRESSPNFELQYSFTQNDELQYTKEKLAETEEKLRQLSENTSKSAKGHSLSSRQLEDAIARANDAERKLLEREDDLVQLYKFTEVMENKHEELQKNVIIHKNEAEDLRRQLAEKQQELEETVAQKIAAESEVAQWEKHSAEISSLTDIEYEQRDCSFQSSRELNRYEIDKLRDENVQLKESLAELTRKSKTELTKSEESVSSLQSETEEMTTVVHDLKSEVMELNKQLHDTVTQFQESERRFNKIQEDAKSQISSLEEENMKLRESLVEIEQQGQIERSLSQEENFLEMQNQVAEMERTIESLTSLLDERSSQLSECKENLSQSTQKLRDMEEAEVASAKEIVGLHQENKRLSDSLAAMEQECERKLEASYQEVANLKDKLDDMSGATQILRSGTEELTFELSESHSLIAQKSKQVQDAETAVAELEQENARLKERMAETEKSCADDLTASAERLVEMQIQLNELKGSVKALESEVDERSNQLLESQALLSEKTKQLNETEATFTKEVEEIKGLRAENVKLKDALGKSKHHAEIDLLEAKGQVEELQTEMKAMTTTIDSLRSDAEKSTSQLLEYQSSLAGKVLLLEEAQSSLKELHSDNTRLKEALVDSEEQSRRETEASKEQISELQTQVKTMREAVGILESTVEAKSSELLSSEAASAEKSKELDEVVSKLDESRIELADTSRRLQEAEETLATLKEEKHKLKESLDEVEIKRFNDIKTSQARVTGLKTHVEEMTRRIESLEADVKSKASELAQSEASSAEKSKQLEELEDKLIENQKSLEEKSRQLEKAENDFSILQQETIELTKSLTKLEEKSARDLEQSQKLIAKLKSQVDRMESAMEMLQSEVDSKSAALQRLESDLADKSEQLEVAETRLAESTEKIASTSKQLDEATAASMTLREENTQLKESLVDAERKNDMDQKASQERALDLQARADDMAKTIESLQADIQHRSSKILAFEASLAEKSKKLEEAGATLTALCNENVKLKDEFEKSQQRSQRELEETQVRGVGLQTQVEEMEAMIQALQTEVDKTKTDLVSSKESLRVKSKKLEEIENQYQALHSESLRHFEAFAEVEKQSRRYVATSQERFAVLQKEADEMAKTMKSLQRECDEKSSQLDESKALLAEKSKELKAMEATLLALEEETKQLRESLAQAKQTRDDMEASQVHVADLQARYVEATARAKTFHSTIEQQALELDESRSLVSRKSAQLEEAETRLYDLRRENEELIKCLVRAEEKIEHDLQLREQSERTTRSIPSDGVVVEHSLVPVDGDADSSNDNHEHHYACNTQPATDLVPYQGDTLNESVDETRKAADEMTRTIHALRSQIEERTLRLIERKKGSKKSKQRQPSPKKEKRAVGADEWKRRTNDAHSVSLLKGELLSSLQKDMENALSKSKETIHRLEGEVNHWKKVASEAEKVLESCQEEFSNTKEELRQSLSSLNDALAREEALKFRLASMKESQTAMEQELLNEKRLKEDALASVDKKLGDIRREYEALMENMKNLVATELMDANAEVSRLVKMHDTLLKDHGIESDEFKDTLASFNKQMAASSAKGTRLPPIDEGIEASPSVDEIESFRSMTNGSSDLESMDASNQMMEMSELNKHLLDAVEAMRDELDELQKENDELQRQLEAKFGLFNKVQGQFEKLQKEYNSVVIENRALRKDNSSINSLQKCVVSAIKGSTEVLSTNQSSTVPVMTRKESEMKIESLTNEKRELMMHSASAISEMQRAEREAWQANQRITKLTKELRAANMAKSALKLCLESKDTGFSQNRSFSEDSCKENEPKGGREMSDALLLTDGDPSKPPLVVSCSTLSNPPSTDETVKNAEPKQRTSGSELLVNDGMTDDSSKTPIVTNVTIVPLEESPSSASHESFPEVECKLSPNELGAELLMNDGSNSPPLSLMSEVKESVSEDESIEEVECSLASSDHDGSTVIVNDRPLPTSAMIMIGVGVTAIPVTPVAQQEPSLVEARTPQDSSEVERGLATAAMVAKLLSQHEMRYLNETRPSTKPQSVRSKPYDPDSRPKPLIWKGYYNNERMNTTDHQEETLREETRD